MKQARAAGERLATDDDDLPRDGDDLLAGEVESGDGDPNSRAKGRTIATSPRSQIIAVSDLEWQEYQPGIRFKILWQDPATKRRAQMAHFAPGAQLPLHRHVGDEVIFVIEGAVSDECGAAHAGNAVYVPDGCVHTVATKNGATVLGVLTGDIEPATDSR